MFVFVCSQFQWKTFTTDATTADGTQYLAVCLKQVLLGADDEGIAFNLGCVNPKSGTADDEVDAIKVDMFQFAKEMLEKWRDVHFENFNSYGNITTGDRINFKSNTKSSFMSDCCNQAKKMSEILQKEALQAAIDHIGQGKWDAMSKEEQSHISTAYCTFCHNHMRNTAIKWVVRAELDYLKVLLGESLKEFKEGSSRVSVDLSNLDRAIAKEFAYGCSDHYAKGHGMSFFVWVIKNHPGAYILKLERAELGSRHDLATEAAIALLVNSKVIVCCFISHLFFIPLTFLFVFLSSTLCCFWVSKLN